jgi:hypothetical protein
MADDLRSPLAAALVLLCWRMPICWSPVSRSIRLPILPPAQAKRAARLAVGVAFGGYEEFTSEASLLAREAMLCYAAADAFCERVPLLLSRC